jgi:hypothetical protein
MRTISYTYSHGEGLTLECELEYSPAEPETEITPAYPAQAFLISAKAGGVDVLPLLDHRIVAMIEEGAAWFMQS